MQKTPDQIFDEFEFRQQEARARQWAERRALIKDYLNHGWPVIYCFGLVAINLAFKYAFRSLPGDGIFDSPEFLLIQLIYVFGAVGMVTFTMQREIRALKNRVAALETDASGPPR
jgi:hypothetical protein